MRELPHDPPIDVAFIDADKPGYRTYYDEIVERLRPGGLVLLDNVLWGGKVVDDDDQSEDTVAIRSVNDHVASDERVEAVMLQQIDGVADSSVGIMAGHIDFESVACAQDCSLSNVRVGVFWIAQPGTLKVPLCLWHCKLLTHFHCCVVVAQADDVHLRSIVNMSRHAYIHEQRLRG